VVDGFVVDLDEVRSVAAGLEALAKTMTGTLASRAPDYGHAQLAQSGTAFADRWGQGVRDLRGDVEGAAVKLRQTADAYEATDAAIANGVSQAGQS
jgi:hypothetical protein